MSKSNRFFCLHTHFYQPPRENPWTGQIPPQLSAWPFDNWNSRIARECYLPNACARIKRGDGKPLFFINNYSYFNFNFGPTLLSWYEKAFPSYYQKIIEAGRESRQKRRHSSAIAQGYNHIIMPLASFQDRLTQAVWGIEDFKMRFGFMPEAMWLPEAAADEETLRLLIDLGMKYVILSPYQIAAVREPGTAKWTDVSDGNLNTRRPYLWRDNQPGAVNRSIAVFVYDGPLSKAAAFEGLMNNSASFADRIQGCFTSDKGNQLVTMAVDGETFGHHHKYAEMTLAYAFHKELKDRGIKVVNFGEYLENNPPSAEIRIKEGPDGEGTAWSCAHGVRRWKGGCPCGSENGDSTEWRQPLRMALNMLRDSAAALYVRKTSEYLKDPWEARNRALPMLCGKEGAEEAFFAECSKKPLNQEERKKVFRLVEMQKNALFMFTSCGWFFSDVSRIETVQNLRYAARVCEILKEYGDSGSVQIFTSILSKAVSNYKGEGTAKEIYSRIVRENAKAVEKSAAFSVARKLFFDNPEKETAETVVIKKRRNINTTLEVAGEVKTCRGGEDIKLSFAYLRKDEEFPRMYFVSADRYSEMEKALSYDTVEDTERMLSSIRETVEITFNDFSPEEKNRYAWMLATAIRDNHSADTISILNDYLYLLRQLPEKNLSSWAPLKAQAADYARQAADIMLRKTARAATEINVRRLAALAADVSDSGIHAVIEAAPETELLFARRISAPALENPDLQNLSLMHMGLKAARLLNAGHAVFHMQNYLYEILIKTKNCRNRPGIHSMIEMLKEEAGMDEMENVK